MYSFNELLPMPHNFNEVEIAQVVSLRVLRDLLKSLSVDGKRWWIASDPQDAIEAGYVAVGHGDRNCVNRLNTITYQIPVLNDSIPYGGTDRIILLFDATCVIPDQPGFYTEGGQIEADFLQDFIGFYAPIKAALIERMLSDR